MTEEKTITRDQARSLARRWETDNSSITATETAALIAHLREAIAWFRTNESAGLIPKGWSLAAEMARDMGVQHATADALCRQAETITRDDVLAAARAWAGAVDAVADAVTRLGDSVFAGKMRRLEGARDDAQAEFERTLDAWRDQQVELARASARAEIDHERTVW